MAITIIAETIKSPGAGNGTTTAAINTTGATSLVIATSSYYAGSGLDVSDSNLNIWVPLTAYTSSTEARVKLWYCVASPSVGVGHTFTVTGASVFATIGVIAWSGGGAYDGQERGASNAATATQSTDGFITPTLDGAIVVSAVAFNTGSATLTVSAPFSKIATGYADYAGSTSEGLGLAYEIQTTATSRNPTWTAASAIDMSACMAVFRPASVTPTVSTTDGKIIFQARCLGTGARLSGQLTR